MAMQRSASSTSFSAMPPEMDEPMTRSPGLKLRDAGAHGLDDAGDLAARRKGARRLELVAVLDDQEVGIVDPAGLDGEQHLSGTRLGIGQLLKLKRLRAADAGAQNRLHALASPGDADWREPELTETEPAVDAFAARRPWQVTGDIHRGPRLRPTLACK